jgi:adenosylhomocysteine nucleosidase
MNTFGIIGAMEEEVRLLKEKSEIIAVKGIAGIEFNIGKLNSKNVIIARCGIGKVNAAVCTQILINMFSVQFIINTGVAGGIGDKLNIGDIVISEATAHHDYDTTAFGYEPGFISGINMRFFKADDKLVGLAAEYGEKSGLHTQKGIIVSGDQFISDAAKKKAIKNIYGALCVDMESAAVGQACVLNGIPYAAIRAISDKADGEATESFAEFVKEAAKKSAGMVGGILERA